MVEQQYTPSPWVVSKSFDMVFFIAPIVLGVLYFFIVMMVPSWAFAATVFVWIVFAQTHFGSTWTIYLDKKNREYYRTRPMVYYGVPVLLVALVLFLGYWYLSVLLVLVAIASFYHVTKQSVGILQLYRHRNQERSRLDKYLEIVALFSWGLLFTGYGAFHIPDFAAYIAPIELWVRMGLWALLGVSLVLGMLLGIRYFAREKNSLPKNMFLVLSLLLYSPYLYAAGITIDANAMEVATLSSLVVHYTQYVGLVWLINRNKYTTETSYGVENPLLRMISGNIGVIAIFILGYGFLMAFLRWGMPAVIPAAIRITPNIVIALVVVHFYLDAWIWKFRNPFIRETVGPFIKPYSATR